MYKKSKQMKNQITIAAVLIITLFVLIVASGMAQDEKEKQVRIKTVKVEDGNKVVKDTTFTLKEGEEAKDIITDIEWVIEGDSVRITTDVFVDEESIGDGIKKVIIVNGDGKEEIVKEINISGHKGPKKVMKFKTDDGKEVIIVVPRGHRKTMVWNSDNDFEYEFDVDQDVDFEFDAEPGSKHESESEPKT